MAASLEALRNQVALSYQKMDVLKNETVEQDIQQLFTELNLCADLFSRIIKATREEGTRQLVHLLQTKKPIRLETIQRIFSQMKEVYKMMGAPIPQHLLFGPRPHAFLEVVGDIRLDVDRDLVNLAPLLSAPIEGIDGEMLPGITPFTLTADAIKNALCHAFREINDEFNRRVDLLQESGLLKLVQKDSPPYSKCACRLKLENLNTRYKTLHRRVTSMLERQECLKLLASHIPAYSDWNFDIYTIQLSPEDVLEKKLRLPPEEAT